MALVADSPGNVLFDLRWVHHDLVGNIVKCDDNETNHEETRETIGYFSCQTWPEDRTILMCTFNTQDSNKQHVYDHFKWKESALLYAVDKLFSILNADSYKRYKYLELEYNNLHDMVLIRLNPKPNAENGVLELYKIIYFTLYYNIQIDLFESKRRERDTGVRHGPTLPQTYIEPLIQTRDSPPELVDEAIKENDISQETGFIDDDIWDPASRTPTSTNNQDSSVWSKMLDMKPTASSTLPTFILDTDKEPIATNESTRTASSPSSTDSPDEDSLIDSDVESIASDTDSSLDDISHELDDAVVLFTLKRDILMGKVSIREVCVRLNEILEECQLDPVELLVKTNNMEKMDTRKFKNLQGRPVSMSLLVGSIIQIIDLVEVKESDVPPLTYESLANLNFPTDDMEQINKLFYFIMFYLKSKHIPLYNTLTTIPHYAEVLARELNLFSRTATTSHYNTLLKTIKKIIEKSTLNTLKIN